MARPYNLGEGAATVIAQLCCHLNRLPQGAPTSPIVANMICARLDGELQRLAIRHRCTYTRYADDLSFSCHSHTFPEALATYSPGTGTSARVGPELSRVVHQNGFRPNPSKVRLQRPSERQEVTGLIVNRDPNVHRTFVRQVRAMLHAWRKFGLEAAEAEFIAKYGWRHRAPERATPRFRRVVKGKLDFLRMIRGRYDPLYRKLLREYCTLSDEHFEEAPTAPTVEALIARAVWVLECDICLRQGTAFYLRGNGLVSCDHVVCDHIRAFRPDAPGTKFNIDIVGRHSVVDLAVLRLRDADFSDDGLRAGTASALQTGDELTVWGFPNFRLGDTVQVHPGRVAGFRQVSGIRRILVSAPIVRGASGGPVLNRRNEVIGVAVTGAETMETAHETEDHGVLPINALEHVPLR